MSISSSIEDNTKSHNIITLHHDVRSPNTASMIITDNTTNSSSNMFRSSYLSNVGGRTRSASTGRDKKSDLRARYWAFLFENLQHAVDELYQTCETDENISECKEVILILENYTREFHNLAEWFRVKWEYENTPPPQRPNSLAWEIRKSSPGKIFRKSYQTKLNEAACRELIFKLDKVSKTSIAETEMTLPQNTKVNADTTNKSISKENVTIRCDNQLEVHLKPESIDCGCQTDDDLQNKKIIEIGRRKVVGSNSLYSKKMTRNFSVSAAPDRNTPIPLTLPIKRLTNYMSPRKPVPGRNIAAPVFIPGKQINPVTSKLNENKIVVDVNTISRSQSDSVFETNFNSEKSELEKCVSVECMKSENINDDISSKVKSAQSLEIINEDKSVLPIKAISEIKTVTDSVIECSETSENCSNISNNSFEERLIKIMNDPLEDVTSKLNDIEKNSQIIINIPEVTDSITASSSNLCSVNVTPQIINEPVSTSTAATEINSVYPIQTVTNTTVPKNTTVTVKVSNVTKNSLIEREKKTESIEESSKKTDTKKTPFKNNFLHRSSPQQWDSKLQKSNVTERKMSTVTRIQSSKIVYQRSLKNVDALKTSSNINQKNSINKVISKTEKPMKQKYFVSSRANYLNGTRPNKGITSMEQSTKCANIMRSQTSVDIKLKTETPALVRSPKQTVTETKELPPRSRRCSKDSDGWEMVISRSRRSIPNCLTSKDKLKAFDINKRFYEPSPSTSLPILLTVDTKQKSSNNTKLDKNKNRNRNNSQCSSNSRASSNNITENCNNYKFSKERPIISSTAMFTTVSSKRKKSNEKDTKKTKAIKDNKRKSSKESDKQINEHFTDEESLRKSKELYEKEIRLQKEINDLQNADSEMDADADSDCTEIDPEIAELCCNKTGSQSERRAVLESKYSHILSNMSWSEQIETLDKLEELLDRDPSGKSLRFVKNFTSLKQFEDLVARWPGRALELHQKLSSPSRKRVSPDSTILQHKARQAKAKLNREQLLQDKSAKIRELFNKVAEVKAMQATLAEERRRSLDQKLKRAEENRNLYLKNKQEKAHDEAKKQKEIAFINELEAQNKRHDFYALCQEQEDRLQSILEERQRRQEEKKAAKEAAVEERRKAIEAERQEKIEELQEKMRKREERIDREFQEKERERIKMAREKARDREDRLLALQAAQIANAEELQKKIQQKQEESARRHEKSIELIRQRAIEIGTPRLTPYQINKLCSLCNVVIDSEVFLLSHLKGLSHQEAVKKYREQFEANVKFSECSIITDAPADVLHEKKNREKERQKTLRKRCKKIRQRLVSRSEKYLKGMSEKEQIKKVDLSNKRRILKSLKEIEKLINTQGNGMWPNNVVIMLERNLFEVIRVLEKGDKDAQQMFKDFEGFTLLSKIYNLALDLPKNMSPYLPLKCFVVASNLYTNACNNNVENCLHVLLSNHIVQILELLLSRLNLIMPNSDDRNGMVVYKADTVADVLMNLCSIILSNITPLTMSEKECMNNSSLEIAQHLQDIVSYIVCTGIVDKLAVYCSSVHDNKSADSYFLLHSIELLTQLVETRKGKITDKEDSTQLMATLKATELVGAVSMLYAMLLHQDSMSNDTQTNMSVLEEDVVNVIIATLRLFSRVGELNLVFFQNILGAEGISLQVRHIISYLLKYCISNDGSKDLLHQVIEFIGFFAIHHHDNQMILQSGSTPTVLQQLSSLPFSYFSNPNLVRILFPTLLACCVDNRQNRKILDQEMSFQLLDDFKNLDDSKDIPLMKLLR